MNKIKRRQNLKIKKIGEGNINRIISKSKMKSNHWSKRKDTCTFNVRITVNTHEVCRVLETYGNHSLIIFSIIARTIEFHWDELKIKSQCQQYLQT